MIKQVINSLISKGIIPTSGPFDITEDILLQYVLVYKQETGGTGIGKAGNIRYARRLAGLNLLKENLSRGAKASDIKAGHIYLISNPAFIEHYKIGVSFDCHTRLKQYQTYSPYRDFVLEKYDFVLDKFKIEKVLLAHPLLIKESGEWIKKENAKTVFDDLAKENIKMYMGCW
jgi:hypothetical protein